MRFTVMPFVIWEGGGATDDVLVVATEWGIKDGEIWAAKCKAMDSNVHLPYQVRVNGAAERAARGLMNFMYPVVP